MLEEIDWDQLREWREYDELEPLGDRGAELRLARTMALTMNIHADTKKHGVFDPLDYLLPTFWDDPAAAEAKPGARRAGSGTLGAHDVAGWDAFFAGAKRFARDPRAKSLDAAIAAAEVEKL